MTTEFTVPWNPNVDDVLLFGTDSSVTVASETAALQKGEKRKPNYMCTLVFIEPVVFKGIPHQRVEFLHDCNNHYVEATYVTDEEHRVEMGVKPYEEFLRDLHMLSAPVDELTAEERQQREEYARR